jgi:hypothetical protein
MRRALVAATAALLFLASGCDGGDAALDAVTTTTSVDHTDTTRGAPPPDARSLLLLATDLPGDAWMAIPTPDGDRTTGVDDPCPVALSTTAADMATAVFSWEGFDERFRTGVVEVVSTYRGDARAAFAAVRKRLRTCGDGDFIEELADGDAEVSTSKLALRPLGDETVGLRMVVEQDHDRNTLDLVAIRRGEVVIVLVMIAFDDGDPALIGQVARAAVSKLGS